MIGLEPKAPACCMPAAVTQVLARCLLSNIVVTALGWEVQDAAFPLFDQVKAEDVVPGITALVGDLNREIDALEESVQPTWEGLIEPLERISDRLSRAWGTVSHLKVWCPC